MRHRLIIEVDGAQHNFNDNRQHDERRDRYFAERGFRTLRFWNSDIDSDLDSVVDTIWHALEEIRPAERERVR